MTQRHASARTSSGGRAAGRDLDDAAGAPAHCLQHHAVARVEYDPPCRGERRGDQGGGGDAGVTVAAPTQASRSRHQGFTARHTGAWRLRRGRLLILSLPGRRANARVSGVAGAGGAAERSTGVSEGEWRGARGQVGRSLNLLEALHKRLLQSLYMPLPATARETGADQPGPASIAEVAAKACTRPRRLRARRRATVCKAARDGSRSAPHDAARSRAHLSSWSRSCSCRSVSSRTMTRSSIASDASCARVAPTALHSGARPPLGDS
jgi:hypothetical protein